MLGRMSKNPDFTSFNLEPEGILRHRTPPITMVEDLTMAKPMKEYFTPFTYTSASFIRIPNMDVNHYKIKSNVIQLLPFLWTYQ